MKYIALVLALVVLCASCSTDIDEKPQFFHVEVEGALLPVLVRGSQATEKIVLYVNGGPGGTGLDVAELDPGNWQDYLEPDVAIAYYDQRGTGNAQGRFTQESMTLNQYVDDIHAILHVLYERYPRARLYLMGHSFGAMLCYRYMNTYGDAHLVEKYIAASGVATRLKDEEHWEIRKAFVRSVANENITNGVDEEYWTNALNWIAEHEEMSEIEERAELFQHMQKVAIEEAAEIEFKDVYNILLFSENNFFPYYLHLKKRQGAYNQLVDEERQWDIKSEIPELKFPLLLIGGAYDISVPPQELEWVYEQVASTEKELVILPDAGHDHYISQPELFANAVLTFLDD